MPTPYKIFKIRFLNQASGGRFTVSPKEYKYYVEKRVFEYFLATAPTNKLTAQDAVPKFTIENANGSNYRDAHVLVTGIDNATALNEGFTYLNDISYVGMISFSKLGSESWSKIAKNFNLTILPEMATRMMVYGQPQLGRTWGSPAAGLREGLLNSSNDNNIPKMEVKKGEQNMFNNLTKGLAFGKVPASQVRMSTLGMAIMGRNGEAYAYDEKKEEFIDVTDFLLDGMDFFYSLPVAKKDVVIGDYILHEGIIVRVVDVNERGNLVAYKILDKEEITIIATKNLFGFDFYTKVVNVAGNLFGQVNSENPFGNILPLLMMKDGGKDNSAMLMMMMMQNGGAGTGANLMSNPMMLYALMNKDGGDNMLPLLLMSSGVFGATATSTKTSA